MPRDIATLRIEPDSLIEAMLEVRFMCADLLDIVPAKLAQYPLTEGFTAQRLPHADIPLPMRQIDPALSVMPILQKVSRDGSRVAKFGEKVFSWHAVGKYPGWSVFSPELKGASTYLFNNIKDVSVTRIGLRYINAFRPELHNVTSTSDLALKIEIAGKPIPREFNLNYIVSEKSMSATVKFATPTFVQGQRDFSLLMDIDVYTHDGYYCNNANQLADWVDEAHLFLKREFYAAIPDGILDKLQVQ